MKQQSNKLRSNPMNLKPRSLPQRRDLLLRLLNKCDELYSIILRLAEFLASSIKEEADFRLACKDLSVGEKVRRLSGWGIASQNFAHRFLDLVDRMHVPLETVQPFLQETLKRPDTRFNELVGMVGDGRGADEVIKLRNALAEICTMYTQYVFDLNTNVEELRVSVNRALEGLPNPNDEAADGPTDANSFCWKGKEVTLSPRPFAVVKFLWEQKPIQQDGQIVRQAQIEVVADVVWNDKGCGERSMSSASSSANGAFLSKEIPISVSIKGKMLKLIISES